ncbi:pentapeptide repeat-containing protein [Bradyrhizobium liaoningense]
MIDVVPSDLHQKLLSGAQIAFPETDSADERRIEASWIREAALNGVPIKITNAVVSGVADFRGLSFGAEFHITRTSFEEFVDLSYATFQRTVEFDDCVFQRGTSCDSARFMMDVSLMRAIFHGRVDGTSSDLVFNDAEFSGVLNAIEVRFPDAAHISFTRSRFKNSAYFSRATFGGELSFYSAESECALHFGEARFKKTFDALYLRVGHYLDLTGARFARSAPMLLREATIGRSVYCDNARFGSSLEITDGCIASSLVANRACFFGALHLANISISRGAVFEGARFGRRAPVIFTGASVSERVDLSRALFKSWVDLSDFRAGSNVVIREARCLGSLDLRRARLGGSLQMTSSHFQAVLLGDLEAEGIVDCTAAVFRGEVIARSARLGGFIFDGQAYAPVTLYGAELNGPLVLSRARFRGRTTALDLAGVNVSTQAYLDEARFYGKLNAIGLSIEQQFSFNKVVGYDDVDLYELTVKRGLFIWQSIFVRDFKLDAANVGGELYLSGTKFKRDASFSNSTIRSVRMAADPERGNRAAQFDGKVRFIGARLGYFGFHGVRCTSEVEEASFHQLSVSGVANFSDAHFAGPSTFYSACFEGEVLIQRVWFKEHADFRGAIFRGNIHVSYVAFAAGADFSHARFDSGASFRANFDGEAEFDMCQFRGVANFSDPRETSLSALHHLWMPEGTRFERASFEHASFAGDARFRNVTFRSGLSLKDCAFSSLQLPLEHSALPDAIDMRGCTYRRISVDVANLLKTTRGQPRLRPYDRQPYSELERGIRAQGDDRRANDVHLMWRSAERKAYFAGGRWGSWVASWIYKIVANYGVRPYQLAVVSAALIVAGTIFFQQPGTLRLKDVPKDANVQFAVTYPASRREAMLVALQQFLPFSISIGDVLLPTTKPVILQATLWSRPIEFEVTSAEVASTLKILGWILVPLGVAGLSGVLRRRPDR